MKKSVLFAALVAISCGLRAQVYINEICPANADVKYDPQYFNFSAWVELYNSGSSSINISGYYLSDKLTEKTKWQIPSGTSIPAKGYLLIWCDGMNAGLHTNFSLDTDGEDVVLSTPASLIVDKVTFTKQHTNIAYGRTVDAGSTWDFLTSPTPGTQNNNVHASEVLADPQISLTPGRYSGAQTITLTHPTVGAEIRFTNDGAEPTISSSTYTDPISVPATSTIKAKAFMDNYVPSRTVAATYFINEHTFSLPVISISTKPAYLWDNTIGIYADGTNGTTGNCRDSPVNWNQDWDRHAVIEYFDPSGDRIFDQAIDIRIGGACSRNMPQKSLVVKARDKYGKKTIEEKLFDTKGSDEYGGFILRNSGNDFNVTMFRDAFMQHLTLGQMDIDYMAYQPTAFYLNGQYWGIQNMREKIDADYIESNYGVKKDDLDLLETGGWALEGTSDAYSSYLDSLQIINIADPASFSFIDRHIDVQEFINYLSAEIYYANTDWPGNNMKFWRQVSTNGKFRWILWDTDFGFALYTGASYPTHPTLNFATDPNSGVGWPNPPWSTLHIRLLLQNPVFRTKFIQTLTTAMGTTFYPERVIEVIDEFQTGIEEEMPFHKLRWGGNTDDWNWEVQRLREFAYTRNWFMQGHIADFFGLGDKVSITIKSSPENVSAFDFNGVTTDNGVTDVPYFKGLPLNVIPRPHTGYAFKSWKIKKRESTTIPLVARGDSWKYYDQGSSLASWNTEVFNDAAWSQGQAQLGYGDGDEATAVGFGPDAGNKYITTYFRKNFTINDLTGVESATGSILFDDGVIVYLNGVEVYRNNMSAGAVGFNTPALVAVADENLYNSFTINKSALKSGNNVLAVELHQSSAQSSDISFDFELQAIKLGAEIEVTSDQLVLLDTAYTDLILEASFDEVVINDLVINEFSATNSLVMDEFNEAEDWIEIYNPGSSAVDLAGLYITDNLVNKTKFQIPAGTGNETIVQPGQYKVLWADEDVQQGPLHLNFKLSAEGESIGLYQGSGANAITLDEVTYNAQLSNYSSARIPNGTGPFLVTSEMTPGSENILATGIEEEEDAHVVVYPNPTSGTIRVKSDELIITIGMYDIYGRMLNNVDVNAFTKELSLSSLHPGLYVLRVKSRKGTVNAKVIRE